MVGHDRGVVLTGVGPLSSVGTSREAFWDGLLAGRSAGRRLGYDWLDERLRTRVGAPIAGFDPADFGIDGQTARLLDPVSQYAIAAGVLALRDAGLVLRPPAGRGERPVVEGVDPERAGVFLGSGVGGLSTVERSHRAWATGERLTGVLRYALPMLIPNAPAAQLAIHVGFRGECKAVSTACAAGTMAIGDAYRLIRDGELDLALAGGAEKTLGDADGYGLIGFDLLRTLSTRNGAPEAASRPFDRDRDGFVMSEGAGVVVLEREAHARARGAEIYARVAGYAATCDAHSMLQIEPTAEQMTRAVGEALSRSGVDPAEVGYVNAHGTSTRANDPAEAKALHSVFGRRIRDVLVSSTKSMTGHAIAASGALEVIATALSLSRRTIHRCVNLDHPDPECDLNLPLRNSRLHVSAAMTNTFGFGGHNACLVLQTP